MPCEEVAPHLAGVVDGSARLDRVQRRHLEQCLRCQAELARYRKLRRVLRDLRGDRVAPPPDLVAEVFAALDAASDRSSSRLTLTARRAAYLGGIAAAATAAGAGAAIVLVSRGRRGRLPLAG